MGGRGVVCAPVVLWERFCCFLVANVYLRDSSTEAIAQAATLRQKFQIKLVISSTHNILTHGLPVLPSSDPKTSGIWRGNH